MAVNQAGFDKRAAASSLRRLTMAELRALAAVKAAGTMSGAADTLGLAQPTLSQHIRDIEEKLSTKLFDRHRRGIEPTRAGLVMLRLAGALQTDFVQAAEELSMAVRADERPIRVGSMPITSGGVLAVTLGRFTSASPATAGIVVLDGLRELLLEHLRHGRIDVFVGRLPEESECGGLHRELLFHDTGVIIAAPKHRLAAQKKLHPKQLESYRWVMPGEDTTFYRQIEQTLRHAGCSVPAGVVRTNSMQTIPALVACSDLLGFVPASLFAAGTMGPTLKLVPVNLAWVPAPIGLLMRREIASQDWLQSFLRTLREVSASARMATGPLEGT